MDGDIDLEQLQKEIAKHFEQEFQKLLYSELNLSSLLNEQLEKQIRIDSEYQQDSTYYNLKYWWSMPYPKGTLLGIVNISS